MLSLGNFDATNTMLLERPICTLFVLCRSFSQSKSIYRELVLISVLLTAMAPFYVHTNCSRQNAYKTIIFFFIMYLKAFIECSFQAQIIQNSRLRKTQYISQSLFEPSFEHPVGCNAHINICLLKLPDVPWFIHFIYITAADVRQTGYFFPFCLFYYLPCVAVIALTLIK